MDAFIVYSHIYINNVTILQSPATNMKGYIVTSDEAACRQKIPLNAHINPF